MDLWRVKTVKRIKSKSLLNKYVHKYNLEGIFDDYVTEIIEFHEFNVGEFILEEAEDQAFYYFLVEGKAKVCPSSVEGQVVLLDFMEPIDIIGDIEYVFKTPNYHSVLALKKTLLIAIPLDIVEKYLYNNIYFYRYITEIMAKKIMQTSKKFSMSMMYPLKVRLAMYLLEHYEDQVNHEIVIKFKEVADYFGITPRHLRRNLSYFESKGILERKTGRILIYDLDMLREETRYLE